MKEVGWGREVVEAVVPVVGKPVDWEASGATGSRGVALWEWERSI
jgi:hypothetical protein